MKPISLLPLAAAASAFVIPDLQTMDSLSLETQDPSAPSLFDKLASPQELWGDIDGTFSHAVACAKKWFGDAVDFSFETAVKYGDEVEGAFAGESWLESAEYDLDLFENPPSEDGPPEHGKPPGRGRPGKPGKPGKPPKWRRPGPPGKGPHHRHHHGPANLSVYEVIAKSNYTTKLAAAINEYPDLVKLLNGTSANFTVFAPIDAAFEKIPEHAPKPSKEFLEKLLTYHVSPEFYPAGRILFSRTLPTALNASLIGDVPQRLSTQIGFRGLTLNYYAHVVAANIFCKNGVIHGISSLLFPPPKVLTILSALPGEFSTLDLALEKTGIASEMNETHHSGTIFAPSNFAFKKLGPGINAFLFSSRGLKYLKALVLYHIVDGITLYSDAIYKAGSADSEAMSAIPKGKYHIDLPTALKDRSLGIDIARFGRMITIKINGFTNVAIADGIAADGVIHVVPSVLIPPKTPGMPHLGSNDDDEELSVEDLIERLEPYVDEDYKVSEL